MKRQAETIARGIRTHWKKIQAAESSYPSLALSGFPFDAWLLELSPLYLKSRKNYLAQGGKFQASVISSPRTLSSDSLLSDFIEYSPIAAELYWSARDPLERKNPAVSLERILELRSWCAPVFHEQTHRLLWKFLPGPPQDQRSIHRYLNFCESLVVATDMALGDFLGERLSRIFYLTGATYDPGTSSRKSLRTQRAYRNYLHAAVLATYLNLELFESGDIHKIVRHLHPSLGAWAKKAVSRCLRLDRGFVEITNVIWQEKNWRKLRSLRRGSRNLRDELKLPQDPLDDRLIYLWSEKWFDEMDI